MLPTACGTPWKACMFVPATAAPHLGKKTPASLGQFKNGTGQKRFKLKNGLHKRKKERSSGRWKKMLHQAPQLWKGPGFIPTLQKKINKKTAPHQTYFVCSSLLMMVATATAKAPSTERVSCNESHFQPMMSTRKFVSQNRYPGAADSWASVFRPDFRPKRCHHPKPCQKIETATQPQHGCLMAHLFPCTATSDELLNI